MGAKFRCPVCKGEKLEEARGKPNFLKAPNKGKICLECVNKRDLKQMAAGRVTMVPTWDPKKMGWMATSRGGGIRYPLTRREGANEGQIIGVPSFVDDKGHEWRGRFYHSSGVIHFQRVKKAAPKKALARTGKGDK